MRRILVIAIIGSIVIVLGGSMVFAQGGNIYVVPSPVTCATPVASSIPATPVGCARVNPAPMVVLIDLGFSPDVFTIPADVPVTITLHNAGIAYHNFTVDGLGIWQDVLPGETRQVTITAPIGDYPFYCDVPGHKQGGMIGLLRVR